MEAFLVSTGVVALAELGDKSQLLVLGLAARFRKPVPIILGIFLGTLDLACQEAASEGREGHQSDTELAQDGDYISFQVAFP